MAISKNDCLLLLAELKTLGIDTSAQVLQTVRASDVPLEVIKFINSNRQLHLTEFYEKIRKNYNKKKQKLYLNIVREEQKDPADVLTTLASLNLQILLFAKTIDGDVDMFLRHSRFAEINQCLLNYSKTGDLIPCQKLLKRVKADLKCLESFKQEHT